MTSVLTEATNRVGTRRDLVTVVIGMWLVGAVFSDGWAHFNVPALESFFTPWHLALYSGFAVVMDFPPVAVAGALGATGGAVLADLALTRLRPGTHPRAARRSDGRAGVVRPAGRAGRRRRARLAGVAVARRDRARRVHRSGAQPAERVRNTHAAARVSASSQPSASSSEPVSSKVPVRPPSSSTRSAP